MKRALRTTALFTLFASMIVGLVALESGADAPAASFGTVQVAVAP